MRLNSRPSRFCRWLVAVAALAILAGNRAGRGQDAAVEVKNPLFAEFETASFVEHTPEEVRKKLEGKTVGLYFTAKWCVACRVFTPKLIKLRDENADEFEFIMVSWDQSLKDEQAYLAKAKMNVPAVRFDDPLVEKYNERHRIDGVPTLLVFDDQGQLLTPRGWECMSWTLRPGVLEQLGDSPPALAWRKFVAPFQDELQAKRVADLETMKPVIDKYKDFPHIDEIADWLGYYGASGAVNEILRKVGKEMAADWENQKHHLEYLADLAVALKPKAEGYIGILESSGSAGMFEELGRVSGENADILATLNRLAKGQASPPHQVRLHAKWGLIGLVAAALEGNDDAMARVIDWRNSFRVSHAPLQIYPILYPACRDGNPRALAMAKQIYVNDPYYVYKALSAFVTPALDGNATALEALGLIAAGSNEQYAKYAVRFLKEAAEKGHDKAKETLQTLPTAEAEQADEKHSDAESDQSGVAAKQGDEKGDAKKDFSTQLTKDCYVLSGGKLAPVAAEAFSKTRLCVVYYSHIDCTGCVPTTQALNRWHVRNLARRDVSLVFATRGEETNEKLASYLDKSLIAYPAIDTKYYMAREAASPHPFYEDADDGVPFIRFFDGSGQSINPRKHGVQDIYDCDSITKGLDGIIQSMLKSLD